MSNMLSPAAAVPRQSGASAAIDLIVAEHGAVPVLLAAVRALLRRRSPPRTLHARELLDDRLRRDIGLAPLGDRCS